MSPPAIVSMTLTFEPVTFETQISSLPDCRNICASFGSNHCSGSKAIELMRFLWPSLPDLELWTCDLEMSSASCGPSDE